jgi:rhamnosyltransferase
MLPGWPRKNANLEHLVYQGRQDPHTCAVMVTFHPTQDAERAIAAAQVACGQVFIVDNTGGRKLPEALLGFADAGCCIRQNSRNLGIGAGINLGVKDAAAKGYTRALLLDQDSVVEESIARELGEIYDGSKTGPIAAVGARYHDQYTQSESARHGRRISDFVRIVKAIQTSGSLIDVETFTKLGGYREDLFMDDVDHEFCLRAGVKGHVVLQTDKVLFHHALGKMSQHRFFLKTWSTFNHSPSRHYYMTRNLVLLAREYGKAEPRWITLGIWNRFKALIKALVWEDEKTAKLTASVLGLWHGVLGRTGPLCGPS